MKHLSSNLRATCSALAFAATGKAVQGVSENIGAAAGGRGNRRRLSPGKLALALLAAPLLSQPAFGQTTSAPPPAAGTPAPKVFDPGPRPVGNQSVTLKGAIPLNTGIINTRQPRDANGNGAGQVLADLTADQTAFWFASLAVFGQEATVNGVVDPATNNQTLFGLGPAFNGNSCFMCHSFPAIGGTSPTSNPQVAVATLDGATNSVPTFVTTDGPIREARFVAVPSPSDGLPAGAVRELFTIQGRTDAPSGCFVTQPNFAQQVSNNNIVFRIPTPTFGLGYIENTSDQELRNSFDNASSQASSLGISGSFNSNGNDQTITRFGWKAQNKSGLLFAGEAANVELGVTNELFTNERIPGANCDVHELPEDFTQTVAAATLGANSDGNDASLISSDIVNFGLFMRLNAAPGQCAFDSGVSNTGAAVCNAFSSSPNAGAIFDGENQFVNVGCDVCHTETLVTNPSPFASLSNATYQPFSDFALHDMGSGLADGVTQGLANGKEFRTAPLWGLGQRNFFLHDGRTSDLLQAIAAHKSSGSEANMVIASFNALTSTQQQDLLDFLRSL